MSEQDKVLAYMDIAQAVSERLAKIEQQRDELAEAATDVHKWLSEFTSADGDPVAYGHYLGLGHVLAKYRQPSGESDDHR